MKRLRGMRRPLNSRQRCDQESRSLADDIGHVNRQRALHIDTLPSQVEQIFLAWEKYHHHMRPPKATSRAPESAVDTIDTKQKVSSPRCGQFMRYIIHILKREYSLSTSEDTIDLSQDELQNLGATSFNAALLYSQLGLKETDLLSLDPKKLQRIEKIAYIDILVPCQELFPNCSEYALRLIAGFTGNMLRSYGSTWDTRGRSSAVSLNEYYADHGELGTLRNKLLGDRLLIERISDEHIREAFLQAYQRFREQHFPGQKDTGGWISSGEDARIHRQLRERKPRKLSNMFERVSELFDIIVNDDAEDKMLHSGSCYTGCQCKVLSRDKTHSAGRQPCRRAMLTYFHVSFYALVKILISTGDMSAGYAHQQPRFKFEYKYRPTWTY